jgi:hypothetical protein
MVAANADTAARVGVVAIADQTFMLTQTGETPAHCTYTIAPGAASVGSEGGTGNIAVSAGLTCPWTATSGASWLHVTGGAQGIGNGTVSYAIDRNVDTSGRSAAIAIADRAFDVTQSGAPVVCEYAVAPVQFTPCMPAATLSTRLTTQTSCPWTVTSNTPWLVVSGSEAGSGPATIFFSFLANYDAPREGLVMVRWPSPTAGQNVRVTQAGCRYAVSRDSLGFSATGGSGSFDVIQQSDPTECGGALQDACIWTATADVPWITITTSMPRAGDNPVFFVVAANGDVSSRTGSIRVRDKIVQITQAGR